MAIATIMILMMMILLFSQLSMEISAYGFLTNQVVVQENLAYKVSHGQVSETEIITDIETAMKEEQTEQITTTQNIAKEETEPAKKTSQSVFLLSKPIKGGITTSKFGDTVDRSGPHIGHDWAVSVGTKVKASGAGVVKKAYYSSSYGYNVLIDHSGGVKTRYAHMSELTVEEGQQVEMGQLIGYSGNTGQSTGPHLHFEVIVGGNKVNPLKFITQN